MASKSTHTSGCARSSEEYLYLFITNPPPPRSTPFPYTTLLRSGIPSSKGCQKFSRGSGLKTKVLDNVKEYPHLWLCARSSEECLCLWLCAWSSEEYLYLKSAYASGYVRSSEECPNRKK